MDFIFDSAEKSLGISFNPLARQRFATYCERLLETNKVMNLTAITQPDQVYLRHFIDSAAMLSLGSFELASVIDVGCGAGFPGLPLKITQDSIRLTLLDSLGKRISFLQSLTDELGLQDVRCIHARAEEQALLPDMRESFDFAVSRAVASLPMLSELCLPYVREGGKFIAMKAQDYREELALSENAISTLGGKVCDIKTYSLPDSDIVRALIVIEKAAPTPQNYPRRFAKIQKKPL